MTRSAGAGRWCRCVAGTGGAPTGSAIGYNSALSTVQRILHEHGLGRPDVGHRATATTTAVRSAAISGNGPVNWCTLTSINRRGSHQAAGGGFTGVATPRTTDAAR